MSWSGTYSHNLLLALDFTGAIAFWNAEDITISSMCGIVQQADAGSPWAQHALPQLKLWGWQIAVLRWLAPKLNDIQANHCELAIEADYARALHIEALLAGGTHVVTNPKPPAAP